MRQLDCGAAPGAGNRLRPARFAREKALHVRQLAHGRQAFLPGQNVALQISLFKQGTDLGQHGLFRDASHLGQNRNRAHAIPVDGAAEVCLSAQLAELDPEHGHCVESGHNEQYARNGQKQHSVRKSEDDHEDPRREQDGKRQRPGKDAAPAFENLLHCSSYFNVV